MFSRPVLKSAVSKMCACYSSASAQCTGAASKRIVRGIVFDMDGTLTIPVIDFKMMRQRVGVPDGADILAEVNSWPHDRRVRGHEIIAEVEDQALADMAVAPGAVELCAWLDKQSVPRALVTRNVARAVHYFHKHHFPHAPFHPAIDRDWGPWKPSPAALEHICELWGIPTSEAVMVGDSAKDDVVSANRAGALSILLDAEGRYSTGGEALEGEAAPSHLVASLADAARVLREVYDVRPPEKFAWRTPEVPLAAGTAG